MKNGSVIRFLLLCGVFAPATMVALVVLIGQITANYSPVSDTISQLGTSDKTFSQLFNTGMVFYGLTMGGVAYGYYKKLSYLRLSGLLAILLVIYGFGTVFLAIFPDSPSLSNTQFTDDILHNTFSAISYSALLLGMLVTFRIAREEKVLKPIAILGLIVFLINLPIPLITLIDPLKPVSGLLQRLFVASSLLWLILTSWFLYSRLLPRSD